MYRNVKKQLRADGPWPVLPPCTICRPENITSATKFKLLDPATVVLPPCPNNQILYPWDGIFASNGGNGCSVKHGMFGEDPKSIGQWKRTSVEVRVFELSAAVEEAYLELRVSAYCPAFGTKLVWRGRKFTGPSAAGVYDVWYVPGTAGSLSSYGPPTMTIVRL
jgi:hypothetical protein